VPAASFFTLGCRLNQLETESIAEAFQRAGYRTGRDGSAELVVINTCTVTSKAEQKARRLIRLALRQNPDATVFVTGCYAELAAAEIEAISPRVVVIPGSSKSRLLGLAQEIGRCPVGHGEGPGFFREALRATSASATSSFDFAPSNFTFHSRAALKVEDGCDNACAFCRVHIARGPARSLAADTLIERVRALETSGMREVVLTGVNLSHYRDGDGSGFPELLARLLAATDNLSFRVSSYEPDRVTPHFIQAVSHERVRPFFHLPIQSGSASVLRRMNRASDVEALLSAIAALRAVRDDPFIAFDLIAGFPGETEAEFAETLDFAARADPAWIHVFPFSPRPGTPALSLRPHVPERVTTERAERLTRFAKARKTAYVERNLGKSVKAIVETIEPAGLAFFTENALSGFLPRTEGLSRGQEIFVTARPSLAPEYDIWAERA
jgi:threonylcarbamoyladenosine tRNA methylthiotransferase MtaB